MAQVVSLEAVRALKAHKAIDTSFIDDAYAALKKLPDFRFRDSQRELSIKIHEAFVTGKPLAAEAPTGTGKTLAYLVAALAAQKSRPETDLIPIVVATATVGLQEQVLQGDLPKLIQAGLIGHNDALIAKGRGRYLCLLSAERLIDDAAKAGQYDFFDAKTNDATAVHDVAKDMLGQFNSELWGGDRDNYSGPVSPSGEVWARLAASADTCIQKRCAYFENCPFFSDRAKMMKAKLIVANHDLVLSDLKMAKTGEQQPLFPGDKYLLIFDEAHNLPDKALNAGSAELDLEAAQAALAPLPAFGGRLFREPEIAKMLRHKEISGTDFEPGPAMKALATAASLIRALPQEEDSTIVKLGREELPQELNHTLSILHGTMLQLQGQFIKATTSLRNSTLPEKHPHLVQVFSEVLFQASYFGTRLKEICNALTLFLAETQAVRWLDHTPERVKLHTSPLEGADFLRAHLWQSERALPILISATMRTFGNFDRFRARSGLPQYALTHTVEPIFRYEESTLVVATQMTYSPKFAERPKWEAEVGEVLPQLLRNGESSLVLFPSQSLLRRIVPSLREHYGDAVLVQREVPFSRLVQLHRERTDAGKTSILCGLATLAEGLDLPGKYCTHVLIVALPFAVPTNPVERELQDSMGFAQYFRERSMPDTQMHLVQMVGRLIRRESDRGRITVLDKRLWEAWWGQKMLKSLPPFHKRKERTGDRQVPGTLSSSVEQAPPAPSVPLSPLLKTAAATTDTETKPASKRDADGPRFCTTTEWATLNPDNKHTVRTLTKYIEIGEDLAGVERVLKNPKGQALPGWARERLFQRLNEAKGLSAAPLQ